MPIHNISSEYHSDICTRHRSSTARGAHDLTHHLHRSVPAEVKLLALPKVAMMTEVYRDSAASAIADINY